MESLRHQLLQAELTRIEQEAEGRSIAVMNKIDALVAATLLCARINDGIENITCFEPAISYGYDTTCNILIHPRDYGDVFIRRLSELGLSWQDVRESFDEHRAIIIDSAPGVEIIINSKYLAPAMKAAA